MTGLTALLSSAGEAPFLSSAATGGCCCIGAAAALRVPAQPYEAASREAAAEDVADVEAVGARLKDGSSSDGGSALEAGRYGRSWADVMRSTVAAAAAAVTAAAAAVAAAAAAAGASAAESGDGVFAVAAQERATG
jgi:hypothetical protein